MTDPSSSARFLVQAGYRANTHTHTQLCIAQFAPAVLTRAGSVSTSPRIPSTVAILAQGTSWAVAVTQASICMVRIPRFCTYSLYARRVCCRHTFVQAHETALRRVGKMALLLSSDDLEAAKETSYSGILYSSDVPSNDMEAPKETSYLGIHPLLFRRPK